MERIFACITHKDGVIDDSAAELLGAAKQIDATAAVTAVLSGHGPELDAAADAAAKLYGTVWKCGHSELGYPNAECVRPMLLSLLPAKAVLLLAHDSFGMDLGPGLSVALQCAFVPDVVGVEGLEDDSLKLVRQVLGGQFNTRLSADIGSGAVLTLRPGSFTPAGQSAGPGSVEDKSGAIGELCCKRRFIELQAAEAGEVDITKEEILVSVGRGIEDAGNIELAQELAEALGGAVSCSRPIVDARWLESARQVGTSGKTVKPKVYLACGISGSFQHLGGLKGSPFLVAINKNPKAPIFQTADVGIVADILDLLPELTEAVNNAK